MLENSMDNNNIQNDRLMAKYGTKEIYSELSKRAKVLNILMLFVPFVSMGMTTTLKYTTIPEMRLRLNTDAQHISWALAFGSAGGLVGGASSAVADRFPRHSDMLIGLCLLCVGVSYALYPFSPNLFFLGAMDFLLLFGWVLYESVAHSVISHITGTTGGPARLTIHCGYPLGAFLGPLVAYPFVTKQEHTVEHNQTIYLPVDMTFNATPTSETFTGLVTTDSLTEDTSNIEYAYLICSAIVGVNAVFFFISQLCTDKSNRKLIDKSGAKTLKSFRQVFSPGEWADGDARFGTMIFIFTVIFYVLHIGASKGSYEYFVTYAVDSEMFSNQEAALLYSVTYVVAACGRFSAIFVARYITAPYMLATEIHGHLLFAILCLFFGTKSKIALWMCAPALGLFRELIWPTGYIWTDFYIIFLGVIVGLLHVIMVSFNMALIPLQGYLYDNTVIESVFYTSVGFGIAQCLFFYVMTYFASRKGGRNARALTRNEKETSAYLNTSL